MNDNKNKITNQSTIKQTNKKKTKQTNKSKNLTKQSNRPHETIKSTDQYQSNTKDKSIDTNESKAHKSLYESPSDRL